MLNCQSRIHSFEFSREEIEEAMRTNRLLSMEIEFSLQCNFRCSYCYLPPESFLKDELTKEEIRDVILQARDLGVKKIVILGGEPMAYQHILDMIAFIRQQDVAIELFTNGFQITADVARFLFDHQVMVVLKMNTHDEKIQDKLAGKNGAYKVIQAAFHHLKQAGYPSGNVHLGVSTIICRQNIDELAGMWQWLRDQNIAPYFEMITPQGRAKKNDWLAVDTKEVYDVFQRIAALDRERYGLSWDPQPPLIGNKCLRHQFSCYVNSHGEVLPCVGVTIPVGNIRKQKLADILQGSEIIQDLKAFPATIKGPCRTCEKSKECYGCRGAAYQLTGDYLASDPLCWRNLDRQEEIVCLPTAVDEIIPQKGTMRVIDTLDEIAEGSVKVSVTIQEGMPFVDEQGMVDEAIYLEMMAQAVAAQKGFKYMGIAQSAPEGFLLGAKNLEISGSASVGDILTISMTRFVQFGDFALVRGTVSRNSQVLAKGEIKVWQNSVQGESD
ncbi:MAG: radical SAM protein [bacterium]